MFRKNTFMHILYLPLSFVFLEICVRVFLFHNASNMLFILLFSIQSGLFIGFSFNFIRPSRIYKTFAFATILVISFYFITEFFLYRAFGYFYPPETIFHMSDSVAGSFGDSIAKTILGGTYALPFFLLPAAIHLFIKHAPTPSPRKIIKRGIILLSLALFLELPIVVLLKTNSQFRDDYKDSFDYNTCAQKYGLICALKLNTVYSISPPSFSQEDNFSTPMPMPKMRKHVEYNTLDIDLRELEQTETNDEKRSLHRYFSSVPASVKNKYTGIFNGKNLIFICAEAFSPYCISKAQTPTLYKLSQSGFVFENYFNPSFGESTSGGEYALLLSQVPKRGSGEVGLSMSLTKNGNMLYSLPALFASNGYSCNGYHNNSYTYYGRNVTHPKMNMSWYGVGGCVAKASGSYLDLGSVLSSGWPRSDRELIEHTFDHYSSSREPFFTYYLTVSGHNNYSFSENTQSRNNRAVYESTSHSEKIKAYFSCQYELEKALTLLMEKLEASGKLDNTVIVLSNDHYPYGLSTTWAGNNGRDYLSELSGGKSADAFEKERGALLICNSEIKEPVKISKPVSAFDVTPTVLNLFGIPYDSRFFVGRDALSEGEGLVFLSNGSFMTDSFRYYSENGRIVKNKPISETEIASVKQTVKNKIKYSFIARRCDYFGDFKDFFS